jgi:hypothetical protein
MNKHKILLLLSPPSTRKDYYVYVICKAISQSDSTELQVVGSAADSQPVGVRVASTPLCRVSAWISLMTDSGLAPAFL